MNSRANATEFYASDRHKGRKREDEDEEKVREFRDELLNELIR
jgi:hypothetical protein